MPRCWHPGYAWRSETRRLALFRGAQKATAVQATMPSSTRAMAIGPRSACQAHTKTAMGRMAQPHDDGLDRSEAGEPGPGVGQQRAIGEDSCRDVDPQHDEDGREQDGDEAPDGPSDLPAGLADGVGVAYGR